MNIAHPYLDLETDDDRPDETEDHPWVPVHNIFGSDVLENLLAFLAQLLEEGVAFLDGRLSFLDDVFTYKKKYIC